MDIGAVRIINNKMIEIYKKTELGTQIRVNNGSIETLIKRELPYGLFQSESGYKVVRSITSIKDSDIVKCETWEQ
jgi:hypothetical protein